MDKRRKEIYRDARIALKWIEEFKREQIKQDNKFASIENTVRNIVVALDEVEAAEKQSHRNGGHA